MKKLFFLITCLWLAGLFWFVETIPSQQDTAPSAEITDCIVVLTGGSDRVAKGFELLLAGKASQLFISGVGEGVTLDNLIQANGGSAAQQKQLHAVQSSITLGRRAPDTRSNSQETRDWINQKHFASMRLVTSNYHMPRALKEFTRRLPNIKIIQEPVIQNDFQHKHWWRHASSLRLVISEYLKFIAVRLGR